jgi:translocation and assembly module TamA
LSLRSQLSPVASEFTANYRFPYGDPRFEWASFDGGIKREETDSATSKSLEFGARRVLERAGGWSRTQFVNLLVEDFDVAAQLGRSRLLMPGISWARIEADNTLRPSKGTKLDIELRVAGDAFGSDTSFAQVMLDYKWIRAFGERGRVLLRTKLGATAEDRFEDLPPSVRFFAGGDNSIRGYDFESLGPTDLLGQVVGGSGLLVGSVEYEYQVRSNWSVAVFVDSGNAFRDSRLGAKTGVGIGTRWQSPLGPIRLDLGFPVNDPGAGARIHVSLGPDL